MEHHKEMQLLSSSSTPSSSSSQYQLWPKFTSSTDNNLDGPSLDLQLSISVNPLIARARDININNHNNSSYYYKNNSNEMKVDSTRVEALKQQAAEQLRLAAMERAYAERLMEITRREMELAQSEFARARSLWKRAKEEVERAEKIKESAEYKKRASSSACLEMTCMSCRQKFRP